MRFYTKEWYELMQHQHDAWYMKFISEKEYTDSDYQLQQEEDKKTQKAVQKIVDAADEEFSRQQIPERIKSTFCFHDNDLLSFQKQGNTYEMLLQKEYGWSEEEQKEGITPYIKIIFIEGVLLEQEAILRLKTKIDEDGDLDTNCIYLYDELYSVPGGYEVHMLFYILEEQERLAYLTIRCSDIHFEDNITLPKAET
ncbi:MAG: DUF4085 family protein [Oscillospiraceae bacterium]|nr:DUF4085 family protein [Oscillospiraceae bacterium]